MNGIYIHGMAMPTSCFQCEFRTKIDPDNLLCLVSQKTFEERFYHFESRDESCPLVPVPEHGRLIDADALMAYFKEIADIEWNKKAAPINWSYAFEDVMDDVENMPTIIPADKEGESGE